jgi:hypothetical protein
MLPTTGSLQNGISLEREWGSSLKLYFLPVTSPNLMSGRW